MSADLLTKDGSFSVVGARLADEKACDSHVPISMECALEWAQENKVSLKGGQISPGSD